jgi:DNA-binding FrmR family transcriptional regulator
MIKNTETVRNLKKLRKLQSKTTDISACCKSTKQDKTTNTMMQPKLRTVITNTSMRTKSKASLTAPSTHPDHHIHLVALRRIQGQVTGLGNMIEERRYCVDVMTQLRAASASLRSIEASILETHLRSCVQNAIEAKNAAEVEIKINELMKLFSRH